MVRVQPGVRSGRARLLCDSCFQVYFIDVGMLCSGVPLDYEARYDMSTGKTHCYAVQGKTGLYVSNRRMGMIDVIMRGHCDRT
jgi:hypothetical protein